MMDCELWSHQLLVLGPGVARLEFRFPFCILLIPFFLVLDFLLGA